METISLRFSILIRLKPVQKSKSRPSVLILGGGFAGVSCAGRLSKHRFDVCLVDQKPHFEFLPNIHEILSGVKRPRDVRLNLADQMAALGHRFTQASVQSIAPEGNRVTLDNGTTLHYDFLVVALGAVDAYYGVTGIDANALSFKSAAQCDAIGQRLKALKASSKASRVTIIGAGITGVEALGEILRRGALGNLKITMLEAQEQLLPSALAKQAYHAIDMGENVAHNIKALTEGNKKQRYKPSPKPQLISFGGLGCIMLAGKWAAGAPVLSAGKEAVFEVAMAQLDKQAAPEKTAQLLRRGMRASDKLFWPTVMSPTALLRQKNFEVLS